MWQAILADRDNWRFGYPKPNLTVAEHDAQEPILPARSKVIS